MFRFHSLILPLCLVLIVVAMGIFSVSADTKTGYFYVKANLPENQINKSLGYFDLRMNPKQNQTLTVAVFNNSNRPIQISVGAITATTNANGIIEYVKEAPSDKSLKYSFTEMVTVRNELITIPPNGSKNAFFDVKMPEEKFDGAILGGFSFTQIPDEDDQKNSEKKLNIKNKIAYAVAVKLTENKKKIKPQLVLNNIQYKSVDYKPAFVNTISNVKPKVMEALALNLKITNLDNNEVLLKHNNEKIAMAPNSIMPYRVFVDPEIKVIPGNYLSYVELIYHDEKFILEKEFKITDDHISAAENPDLPIIIPFWLGAMIFIIMALIVISVTLYLRMKKYKKRAV